MIIKRLKMSFYSDIHVDWDTVFKGQQNGHGHSEFYIGNDPYQRGYGFFSQFRFLLPIIRSLGSEAGNQALNIGLKSLQDIAQGERPSVALKKNLKEGFDKIIGKHKGSGTGKKKRKVKALMIKSTGPKKRSRAIGVYKL